MGHPALSEDGATTDAAPPRDPQVGGIDFFASAAEHFSEAADRGFPLFGPQESLSNAVNSTPYYTPYSCFLRRFSVLPVRAGLCRALDGVRGAAQDAGASVAGLLVGGSFLDLSNPAPYDLDCLMLYQVAACSAADISLRLVALRRAARALRVDVRFIPVDHDPLMLVKIVSYFTTLYNRRTGEDVQVRGLLLVDCR